MKKFSVLMLTVFLSTAFYSCTPQALTSETEVQATGGDDDHTPVGDDDDDESTDQ